MAAKNGTDCHAEKMPINSMLFRRFSYLSFLSLFLSLSLNIIFVFSKHARLRPSDLIQDLTHSTAVMSHHENCVRRPTAAEAGHLKKII